MPGVGRPMHPYEMVGVLAGSGFGLLLGFVLKDEIVTFAFVGALIGWIIGGLLTWLTFKGNQQKLN
jgi:hypothetical protein